MTTEDLIAHHVEALVSLGWHWQGRGLVPPWGGQALPHGNHQHPQHMPRHGDYIQHPVTHYED